MPKRYRLFGTTADVGVTSRGRDMKEAFENQAAGMFSIMADLRTMKAVEEYVVEAEGSDNETLLVAWLNELLFIYSTKNMFLKKFEITRLDGFRLKSRVWGEEADPSRHVVKTEVKAVTYHMLLVSETPEGVETRVVYDI